MKPDYRIQTTEPLYPNMIWSRPENKQGAGKLLIIGGQAQEFITVAQTYTAAEKAGAGSIRVILPVSTRSVTKMLPNIEYAPANPSGSFARAALAELLEAAQWSDAVLLAGDMGKNSETSLLLESLITSYSGLLIINQSALESITIDAHQLYARDNTIVVITREQLQKTGIDLGFEKPVTSRTGNPEFGDILHTMIETNAASIVVIDEQNIWTAADKLVALTHKKTVSQISEISAASAVWSMQNPQKIAQALSTAVYCI